MNDELIIVEEKEKVLFKPSVIIKEDVLTVSMLSLDAQDSLDIAFYDENDRLLYTESITGKYTIGKKLNTGKLLSGTYSLVLRSKGETFYKRIKL